ncbi:hypothetical protein BAE44_0003840 [Dichanthelium oligosanthes]|uniref:F-box domain-containing protein n=1 Tax=Dichanthelium oligosanthes TaxID=888268 RepID=A0A1E5WCH2_9POAL|nr:hypothetical protein BAE44_0003840 [Dichanthelium oligosanthes]
MRGIREKFRAALRIPGGNPDLVAGGGEGGGREGQEDLLSALPDDVLLLILLCLPSAALARLWAHLPELRFPHPADLVRTCDALIAHAAPAKPHRRNMVNCQFLMGAITMLADIESLNLGLSTCGHAIGPCVFHLLKICSGIRKLNLNIHTEERAACSPGCVCHQPQDWETEEFLLNSLQEVNIFGLSGADSDFAFVKGLRPSPASDAQSFASLHFASAAGHGLRMDDCSAENCYCSFRSFSHYQ